MPSIHPSEVPVAMRTAPFRVPGSVRLMAALFGPVVRTRRRRAREEAEKDLRGALDAVCRCNSRTELEAVLGPPSEVLSGHIGFRTVSLDGEELIPDRVERYSRQGFTVELWFLGTELRNLGGHIPWTTWDVAAGLNMPSSRVRELG